MRVMIIGAGGHGQVVADILQANLRNNDATPVQPIGYLDDDPALQQRFFLDLPVLGTIAQAPDIRHEAVIVAIGDNSIRQEICRRLAARSEQFVSVIHPTAVIGPAVEIGPGTMICAGVVVNTSSRIGRGVILNTACTVDHHNDIEDYVHVAPGVHMGGHVRIGEGALVGIGATVIPYRSVGAWATVGAGAVVTRDIPANTTAVGVPAHVIKADAPK